MKLDQINQEVGMTLGDNFTNDQLRSLTIDNQYLSDKQEVWS